MGLPNMTLYGYQGDLPDRPKADQILPFLLSGHREAPDPWIWP